jgi:hypothetical protein
VTLAKGLREKVLLYRRVALPWIKLRGWGLPSPRDIFLGAEHEQFFANVTSNRYAAGTRSGITRSLDSGPAVKYLIGSSHVLKSDSDSCDLRVFEASNQPLKNVPGAAAL